MYPYERLVGSKYLRACVLGALTQRNQMYTEDDVDDMLSNIHIKLVRHGDFKDFSSAKNWIGIAARSAVIDRIRHLTCTTSRGRAKDAPRRIPERSMVSYDVEVPGPFGPSTMHELLGDWVEVDPIGEITVRLGLVQALEMARRDMGPVYHDLIDRLIHDVENGDHVKLTALGAGRTEQSRVVRVRNYLREHMVESDWL